MATTSRSTRHAPEAVFAVLANGWRYAEWVVGCRRVRAVDDDWPGPGSQFHHAVGIGFLELRDATRSMAVDSPTRLVLDARAWPAGRVRITITVTEEAGGSRITIDEVPTGGPAKTLDNPLLEAIVHIRNRAALRRLDRAAERDPGDRGSD
jgi:uncharacterized protein YndB with AHSA1/START domain